MIKTSEVLTRKVAQDAAPWRPGEKPKGIPQSAFKGKINLNLTPSADKVFKKLFGEK
jgi:hypothetical protein